MKRGQDLVHPLKRKRHPIENGGKKALYLLGFSQSGDTVCLDIKELAKGITKLLHTTTYIIFKSFSMDF